MSNYIDMSVFTLGQCGIKFPVVSVGSKEPMESRYQTNIKDELFI